VANPFAPRREIVACMTDQLLDRVLARSREASYRRRSPAYRWLRERHDKLAPVFEEFEPPLREIADEMAEGRITGGKGMPLTAKALFGIWRRVCRDLRTEATKAAERKAEKAAAVQARGGHPSRLAATWKPTPVDLTLARAISRTAAPTNTDSAPAAPIELSEAARARLAALDRQLDWRDRYVIPPKRKD